MNGSVRVMASGLREEESSLAAGLPYHDAFTKGFSPATIVAVPYHQWGNRAPGGEMRVWLRAKE